MSQVGTVISEGQPLEGQEHRSSENIENFDLPSGVTQLRWNASLIDPGNLQNLRFNVMQDKSLARDPVLLATVEPGTVQPVETPQGTFKAGGEYYIADPINAQTGQSFGASFRVTVETV